MSSREGAAASRAWWRRRASVAILTAFAVLAIVVGEAFVATPRLSWTALARASADQLRAESAIHLYAVNGRAFGVLGAFHVLTFDTSRFEFQIGLAHHAIDGGRQTPGAICQATAGCVAAVNGDYFDMTPFGTPDPGDSVGGVVRACALIHTPEISHQQVDLSNQTVSEGLNWHASLTIDGVVVPVTAINQELPLAYSNVRLPLTGTLLYEAPYKLPVPSKGERVIDEFTDGGSPVIPTTINTTSQLVLVSQTQGPVRVKSGEVDVSAALGSPLASLQIGQTATLTTTSTSGCNDVGGHPILLDHGIRVPVSRADTYMATPSARSVVGWTSSGEAVVVVVDGRDGVSGATANQLDNLLESLGVVTALNLDGGLSSTLYVGGRVVNRPLHNVSRPVSTALLIMPISR